MRNREEPSLKSTVDFPLETDTVDIWSTAAADWWTLRIPWTLLEYMTVMHFWVTNTAVNEKVPFSPCVYERSTGDPTKLEVLMVSSFLD